MERPSQTRALQVDFDAVASERGFYRAVLEDVRRRLPAGLPLSITAVETILRERSYDRVPFSQILEMVEHYQGIGRVKERAQAFTEKARGIIGEFPESPYQRAL